MEKPFNLNHFKLMSYQIGGYSQTNFVPLHIISHNCFLHWKAYLFFIVGTNIRYRLFWEAYNKGWKCGTIAQATYWWWYQLCYLYLLCHIYCTNEINRSVLLTNLHLLYWTVRVCFGFLTSISLCHLSPIVILSLDLLRQGSAVHVSPNILTWENASLSSSISAKPLTFQ